MENGNDEAGFSQDGFGATEHDGGGAEGGFAGEDLAVYLDERAHAALNGGLDGEGGAGGGGAEDFGVFDGGETHVFEGGDVGIGLSDDSSELGDGFDHDDAGPEGETGKVAREEGFVAGNEVGGFAGFSGVEGGDFFDKAEFLSVGEGL